MIVAPSFLILQHAEACGSWWGDGECGGKKGREKEGEHVEARLGYSFCHCCMMFNMPDRGQLAELLQS